MTNDRQRRSKAQEEKTALLHEGQRCPGSGSGWARKGDVRTKLTLIENKRTDKRQITLKADALEKIWVEAWAEGRKPLLGFEIGGRRYVVQNEEDYLEDHGGHAGTATVDEVCEVQRDDADAVLPRPRRSELRRSPARKGRVQR